MDDVDIVVVSAVDDATTPGSVDVYFIPAKFVREAFEASRKARLKAGNIVRENWGMWVALDPHEGDSPAKVGSGFIAHAEWHESVPLNPLQPLVSLVQESVPQTAGSVTIAQVVESARLQIAQISGMPINAIRLELHIGA